MQKSHVPQLAAVPSCAWGSPRSITSNVASTPLGNQLPHHPLGTVYTTYSECRKKKICLILRFKTCWIKSVSRSICNRDQGLTSLD